MNKVLKIIFIACLVIGIAAAGVNFYAASQADRLLGIQEQQAAYKQAMAQIAAADILDIDPESVVVPEQVTLAGLDRLILRINNSSTSLWVLTIDLLIVGAGGFCNAAWKRRKKQKSVEKPGGSGSVVGILIALAVLCMDMTIASPVFLTSSNLLNGFQQISVNFVVAVGMTFVIISGGIDLSVGSNIALSGLLMGILMKTYNVPVAVAVMLCILFSGLIGLVNGALIAFLDLPPFIVTLGTMCFVRGAAYTVTGGQPIYAFPAGFTAVAGRVGEIPLYTLLIMLAVIALGGYFLHFTRIGRFTYAIGGNESCAGFSGINQKRVKCFVYIVSGLCCGIAALLLSSRLDSALPASADGQEIDAIAAAVIGGAGIKGGKGSMVGTLIGILMIGVIANGLNLLGAPQGPQKMAKGLMIVIAMVTDVTRRRAAESAK